LSAIANCRESVAEIHFRYQLAIKGALAVAEVAVNLSAFTLLVIASLLRYAARLPSKQIRSGANRGTGFLAAEMKEYDA
jgi:hypothetical protein